MYNYRPGHHPTVTAAETAANTGEALSPAGVPLRLLPHVQPDLIVVACSDCGAYIRPKKSPHHHYPDTKTYAAAGLCVSCYYRQRRKAHS